MERDHLGSSRPKSGIDRRIRKIDEDIGESSRLPTLASIEPAETHQLGDPLGRDGDLQHDLPKPA
jgi:hypothetical protein